MRHHAFVFSFLVAFLFAFFAFTNFIPYAEAAPVGLKIQPIKVSYTVDPGDVIQDRILLSNPNDTPVFVETDVEDFAPTPGGSSIRYVGRTDGITTVRDWITHEFDGIRLNGHEEKNMPFTIRVPKDAEPGSHFGILFFKASLAGEDGVNLKVGTRVGVLVFVTVAGDFAQSGKIHDFSGPLFVQKGPVSFALDFENTGTVHFDPTGTVTVTNIFGKEVAKIAVGGSTVLPTGRKEITIPWPTKRFFFGLYKANAEIQDGEGNLLTAQALRFAGLPIFYILGVFVALAGVYWVFRFVKSKLNISISIKK